MNINYIQIFHMHIIGQNKEMYKNEEKYSLVKIMKLRVLISMYFIVFGGLLY